MFEIHCLPVASINWMGSTNGPMIHLTENDVTNSWKYNVERRKRPDRSHVQIINVNFKVFHYLYDDNNRARYSDVLSPVGTTNKPTRYSENYTESTELFRR